MLENAGIGRCVVCWGFWKLVSTLPHFFLIFPSWKIAWEESMFVKLKVFFTEDTNHIHLSGAFHISWLLGRLLFLKRLIPPSYSIQCFSICPLYFASYSTNFVRDRDLIPSKNEWVNNTASADLVPSQFNFAEVEKHLKRKLSEGHRKKNKFSKSKKCKQARFLQARGKRKSASPWLKQRKVLHENYLSGLE